MSPAPPSTTGDALEGRPGADPDLMDLLHAWLPGRRWFPAKGTTQVAEHVAAVGLADPQGEAEVTVHLLRLPSGAVLQVPLVLHPDDGADRPGVVGRLPGDAGPRVVVDGAYDLAFVRAFLAAAQHDETYDAVVPADADLTGAKVLSGEQSNTSVLLPGTEPPAILKVFRGISTGANPDVEVPLALSRVGWHGVPRPLAWLTASWPSPDGRDLGHLGVLSELVVGAQDGFELACRHAGDGTGFGELAETLGRTTAQMHDALRRALPVPGGSADAPAPAGQVAGTLRARAAAAVEAAPVLADRADAVEQVLSSVERLGELPPLQRVHGDYHLGQVLHSQDRGWSVLDFEGEPQASAAERNRPDLALRDLAGMLRSMDYASAVGGAPSTGWVLEARERLVAGYLSEAGTGGDDPATQTLLRALELDKALYEVVYETRNRPTWVHIPLDGVDRLLDRA